MAASRLEKVGTIYSRLLGLIERGVVKVEDRPIWFDVYKAFPPMEEPTFSRPILDIPIRRIFYKEDKIRAKFHSAGLGTSGYRLAANNCLGDMGGTKKYLQQYEILKMGNESASQQELILKTASSIGETFKITGGKNAGAQSRDTVTQLEYKQLTESNESVWRKPMQESKVNDIKETDIKDIFDNK